MRLESLFWIVTGVLALLAPLFAAFRVLPGLRVPGRRVRVAAALAFSLALAGLGAWAGLGTSLHFLALFPLGVVIALLGIAAAIVERTARLPGAYSFVEGQALGLWTATLGCGLLLLSYPAGTWLQGLEVARAKAWVERMATEVRAELKATGRVPEDLRALVGRTGAAPRLVPRDGTFGYYGEEDSFSFSIDDPSQFLPGTWVYSGRTGAWERHFF